MPDAVRGRVFGVFITFGGLIGNLSHWMVGNWVKGLGARAHSPDSYYRLYGLLSLLLVLSLLGLPCLHAIRRREKLAGKTTVGLSPAAIRDPQFE